MDYPYGKFGDCSFSRFSSIGRTNRHTHTDAGERYIPATLIGVINDDDVVLHRSSAAELF